jgi:pimeloyl-ACP methyl ester carboxylesterase
VNLYAEEGGSGPDLLVLLHGLGATGAVWAPLLDLIGARSPSSASAEAVAGAEIIEHGRGRGASGGAVASNRSTGAAAVAWHGRWFAPDLPGHGGSPRALRYSVEDAALAVGDALVSRVVPGSRFVVLGHSFGGAIALALASGRFGIQPTVVFGVGIKLTWREEELTRMRSLAAQPAKRFASEAEAWERYLKVSGLHGLAGPASAVAARGIVRDGDAWTLSMDPAANDAGKPAFGAMMADARCPVHLARGGRDPLVSLEDKLALDPAARDLGSHGHNVLVESAETLWTWTQSFS